VKFLKPTAPLRICNTNEDFVSQKREDARLAEERKQLKWQKDHMYDDIHTEDQMVSNQDREEGYLSDFM